MKYANYIFNARGVNNLGDNMQIITIDKIYEYMKIPKEDIIYIDKNKTGTYNGEYVILPVSMPLIDYVEGGICNRFSDHIIPVFIGLTLAKDSLLPQEVSYLKKYEPIGCRDERTLSTVRAYGIDSYLHGCITALLPKRENNDGEKVFIVDVCDELLEFIPEDIKKDAIYLSHMHAEHIEDPKYMAMEYYEKYKNDARLVITSLLHCSVPCMAAGIPVVLAKKYISYRFGWLDKLLPIYNINNFKDIDWNPQTIEYEEHKKIIMDITIDRLRNTFNKYSKVCDLSWFYEDRQKNEYIVDAFESIKQFIDSKFIDKDFPYEYSIWGLTQMSELTVSYIRKKCPNAILKHVYDKYKRVYFAGKISQNPEKIVDNPNEIIIVTTNGAKKMALELFDALNKSKDSYVFFEPIK
ncbi:polysaccharide pyruvyl transferase family protein [Sedimentibacter sp. zth1]|uniref:polysaccharide pyruvyl transferase family protein n=1 Tax=Sedimentibacter sp. zth1 TaxID=2816908 RepID=UPI001A925F88|nr:polysaccharide pyruvyl transferase family protein [Sedimentibacter sp. zth1]QSX07151.1 polysaccharide pyruvyl transferase family protein [Sedimentibacter sp. zth1]